MVRDWSGLWHIWFSPAEIENEAHYWPLVYTTFWLEHKLWGYVPAGYHAVNVLLHLANTLLLWRLLTWLAVRPGRGWSPRCSPSIPCTWIRRLGHGAQGRALGAVLSCRVSAWVLFTNETHPGRVRRRYLLALALFVLGLLCKSIVVTLPASLLIWHWWQQGRVTAADLLRLTPFFAVGLGAAAVDVAFSAFREPISLGYSIIERGAHCGARAMVLRGQAAVARGPGRHLSALGRGCGEPAGLGLRGGHGGLGRGALVPSASDRSRALAGVLFFAVTLTPVLGFVDFGYMQFSLLRIGISTWPASGWTAVLVGAAAHGAGRLPSVWQKGVVGVAAVVLIVLGTLTWRQADLYRDGETFFNHVIAHNPTAREAHRNLGEALTKQGRWEEALAAFRIAVEHAPDDARDHSNVGAALIVLGRLDEAEEPFRRALALDPHSVYALQNLAVLESQRQRYEAALDVYRRLVKVNPRSPSAHHGVGTSLYYMGRLDEALDALERALALDPMREDIRTNRDEVLAILRQRGQ